MNYIMYVSIMPKYIMHKFVPSTKTFAIVMGRNSSYTLASNNLIFQNVLMVEGLAILSYLLYLVHKRL